MLKVGDEVLARYTTVEWYPGKITEICRTTPTRYVVKFFDEEVKGILGDFILPFKIETTARISYLSRVSNFKYKSSVLKKNYSYDNNNLDFLSKKERRKEKNRIAAKLSRERKNKSLQILKEENHNLHKRILNLNLELELLKQPEPIPYFFDFETQLDTNEISKIL